MAKKNQITIGDKKIRMFNCTPEEVAAVNAVFGRGKTKEETVEETFEEEKVDLGSEVYSALGLYRDKDFTYNLVVVKYNPTTKQSVVEKIDTLSKDVLHAIEKFKIESGNQILP